MPRPILLVALLALAACQRPVAPPAPAAAPAPAATTPAMPEAPTAPPAASPTSSAPDPHSEEAAADVIRAYYAAISARDYRRAYEFWGDGGRQSGQTFEACAAGFADTRDASVDIQPSLPDGGAAGSVFATFPVVVTAHTASGAEQRFTGTYRVGRVNGVDGATPEQLRWHLTSARLRPAR